MRVLKSCVRAYNELFAHLKVPVADYKNVDISSQITNIIFTIYSIRRQEANSGGEDLESKASKSGFAVQLGRNRRAMTTLAAASSLIRNSFEFLG
ncbi:hypothetical protein JTB14_032454 [Gonioctena quinquepunctata]|nr:hypothetical protein JTB14_032454 [Gonioctena quinquepunctata]